jgi:hypothetical protein
MKRPAVLLLCSVVSLLLACGKSITPDSGGPLVLITVVDTAGGPAAGIRVGSINHSDYLEKPAPGPLAAPSTDISFSLPEPAYVTMKILNYYGEQVRVLIDNELLSPGAYAVTWDAHDDYGALVLNGFYRYHILAGSFTADNWLVVETAPDPTQTLIGVTDTAGVFCSDDTLLVPCLLGAPPTIVIRDQSGYVVDTVYDFYQDSVTITLSDPAAPDRFMRFTRGLRVGQNRFHFIWDPTKAQ